MLLAPLRHLVEGCSRVSRLVGTQVEVGVDVDDSNGRIGSRRDDPLECAPRGLVPTTENEGPVPSPDRICHHFREPRLRAFEVVVVAAHVIGIVDGLVLVPRQVRKHPADCPRSVLRADTSAVTPHPLVAREAD